MSSVRHKGWIAADMVPLEVKDVKFSYVQGPQECPTCDKFNFNFQLEQGKLVAMVGRLSEGKSTFLKLLGGVLLPDKGDVFIPPHLRVLHVSQEPIFFTDSLIDNLQFGCAMLRKEEREEEERRALRICERLLLPEDALSVVRNPEISAVWKERLSNSEQALLNLARALVANPEVLVLHKPTSNMDDRLAHNTLQILREFVDNRGVEEDVATFKQRRPRTCVLTASRSEGVHVPDLCSSIPSSVRNNMKIVPHPLRKESTRHSTLGLIVRIMISCCVLTAPNHAGDHHCPNHDVT